MSSTPRALPFFSFFAMILTACPGGQDEPTTTATDAGSAGGAAGTAATPSASGGGAGGSAMTASSGGSRAMMGGATGTMGGMPMAPADAAPPIAGLPAADESGRPQLSGKDGITGVADGMLFAYTDNPTLNDLTAGTGLIQIKASGPAMGDWTLWLPPMPGTYSCGNVATRGMAFIQLNTARTGVPRGSSLMNSGGACTVVVKSVVGRVEGYFSAILIGLALSKVPVTGGYFSVPGLADCGAAKDPGLAAGETGATVALTAVGGQTPFRCGSNGKLSVAQARLRDNDAHEVTFVGMIGDRRTNLLVQGLYEVGTFMCGAPGSAMAGAKKVSMRLGDTLETSKGGSCTITIKTFSDTVVEGTYEATVSESNLGGGNATFKGTFRTPRFL